MIQRIATGVLLATVLSPGPSPAQPAVSPQTFLASVYRHYQQGGKGIDIGARSASRVFTRSLLAWVRNDAEASRPGNVGALDADPLCACQDWDRIWNLRIELQPEASGKVQAEVSFSIAPPERHRRADSRTLLLHLVSEHGAWKIDDITDRTNPRNPWNLRECFGDSALVVIACPMS